MREVPGPSDFFLCYVAVFDGALLISPKIVEDSLWRKASISLLEAS